MDKRVLISDVNHAHVITERCVESVIRYARLPRTIYKCALNVGD